MAKKRSNFSFKGKTTRNAEKLQKDASFTYLTLPKDMEVYTSDPGSVRVDMLPYIVTTDVHPDRDDELEIALKGDPWYKRPFKIHRGIGTDEEAVLCLASIGEKCPICEYRSRLKAEGGDEDDIKALKPSERNLYYVIPLNSRKWDDIPYIFDVSAFLFQNLLNDELRDDDSNDNFAHPVDGKTMQIRFAKDSFGGRTYAKASRIDFKERDYVYDWEEDIDTLPSLDEIIERSTMTYKELEGMLMNFSDEDPDEFDEVPDEEPKRTRKPSTRRKPKAEAETTEDDPAEDEPAEEKPKRTRTRKPAAKKDEDKPTRSRTRKPAAKKDKEEECPFDHEFGVDTDEFDDCQDCDLWDACNGANKKNKE